MADPLYEWDEAKREANLAKHGLDFADVARFDFASAILVPDLREDYGEPRFRAYGHINGVACAVVLTKRGTAFRLISLRRANARERSRYGI